MRRHSRLVVGILVTVLISGCASPAPIPPRAAPDVPQAGGRLVLLAPAGNDVQTLQPILNVSSPNWTVLQMLYPTLTARDAQTGEPMPNLARWTSSPDGLTWSLEVDSRATWSDGVPISAEDFVTYLKGFARSKKAVPALKTELRQIVGYTDYELGRASSIAGVRAEGKNLNVTLTAASCDAAIVIFERPPLPSHVFAKYLSDTDLTKNLDEAPENLAPPVSAGPFLFAEWRKGELLVLKRNARYWKGAPLLEEFVQRVTNTNDQVVQELTSGALAVAPVNFHDAPAVERSSHLSLVSYQDNSYTFFAYNMRTAAGNGLDDKRVRQALAYGLDIDLVIRELLGGRGVRNAAHHPQVSWAFPSGLAPYPYDPSRAEALLRSAGFARGPDGVYARNGRPLRFTAVTNSNNPARSSFLQLAAEQYRAIGVQMVTALEPFTPLVNELTTGTLRYDAVVLGWGNILPDPYYIWHSSQIPDPTTKSTGFNFGAFRTPGLDEAIEKGRADCSRAARKSAYDTFNRILYEEQPYNFGFSVRQVVAVPRGLQGLDFGSFGQFHNIEKWWFKN